MSHFITLPYVTLLQPVILLDLTPRLHSILYPALRACPKSSQQAHHAQVLVRVHEQTEAPLETPGGGSAAGHHPIFVVGGVIGYISPAGPSGITDLQGRTWSTWPAHHRPPQFPYSSSRVYKLDKQRSFNMELATLTTWPTTFWRGNAVPERTRRPAACEAGATRR